MTQAHENNVLKINCLTRAVLRYLIVSSRNEAFEFFLRANNTSHKTQISSQSFNIKKIEPFFPILSEKIGMKDDARLKKNAVSRDLVNIGFTVYYYIKEYSKAAFCRYASRF